MASFEREKTGESDVDPAKSITNLADRFTNSCLIASSTGHDKETVIAADFVVRRSNEPTTLFENVLLLEKAIPSAVPEPLTISASTPDGGQANPMLRASELQEQSLSPSTGH